MAVSVGDTFYVSRDDPAASSALHALGFLSSEPGQYRRAVDLLAKESLVRSAMAEVPDVDTIAIISVDRHVPSDQYIYSTLQSLLAELPKSAHVNVLVGSAESDYLSQAILSNLLGGQDASRVHVFAPPKAVDDFFADANATLSARATWNYARALRSYDGESHLLLFEDDVVIAKNSLVHLNFWLRQPPVDVFALFNEHCSQVDTTWLRDGTALTVGASRIFFRTDFPTTQAIGYSRAVTQQAGSYLAARAGRDPYDHLLGRFFGQTTSVLGYVQPSIVQHTGRRSTGLGAGFPTSSCYVSLLPDMTQTAVEP